MEVKEVKSEKIILCDLIRDFMEFAVDKGKLSFPSFFTRARPWHEFLYALKKDFITKFPGLKCINGFDWDSSYPTLSDWNSVALAFTILDICGPRAYSDRNYFYLDRKREVNPLVATHPELLETMFKVACETQGFFED